MIWIDGRPYDLPQAGEIVQSDWLHHTPGHSPVHPYQVGTPVVDPSFWMKPVKLPGLAKEKK